MVMSCPFCGTGTDLPHETQEACIVALHSEISRIRQVVGRLNGPALVDASARQASASAQASARLPSDDISGDNPNPEPPPDERE
jgi:hypothetical protein